MEQTRYEVAGWGVGELWVAEGVVLAHEFDFGATEVRSGTPGRVVPLGTKATFLDTPPHAAGNARGTSRTAADLIARIGVFLGGDDVTFDDVALDLDWCTAFQRSVVTVLRGVRRGDVVSYGELAALAGYPGAQRAAASVCARNRFAFVVPCHRVVAADGIGGYGSAGVAVKRHLLALEGVSL